MSDTDLESMLFHYCDLTPGQWWDLKDAAEGCLEKMNPARRTSMRDLIDHDLKITAFGKEVLARSRTIQDETFPEIVRDDWRKCTENVAATLIRKKTGFVKFYSVHMKVLWALWVRPGLCYHSLGAVYGFDPLKNVLDWEMALGGMRKGAAWELTLSGTDLVNEYLLAAPELKVKGLL